MTEGLRVRGAATAEEVAAVLAVLTRRPEAEAVADGYARWRAVRRQALRNAGERQSPA